MKDSRLQSMVRGAQETPVELPPLPFAEDALDPVISSRTLSFHHGRHHKTYVEQTLELTRNTELEGTSVENIMLASAMDEQKKRIFNVSAQVWNHNFQWQSLRPGGGGMPRGRMGTVLDENFEGFELFKSEMISQGKSHFGSGWLWLCSEQGKLKVITTHDADNPVIHGLIPLLTIDLWEHAYYLDYQNRRDLFLAAVIDSLLNWDFALENLERDKTLRAG